MLALILISFIATGVSAYNYYKHQNAEYQEQRLLRKEYSVEASINYFLANFGKRMELDTLATLLSDRICELSNIHRIPISIFDLNGDVLISAASSEKPNVYVPNKIDPEIMNHLFTEGNSRAVTEKKINANSNYVLSYWYMFNHSEKPIGIVCVRYDKSIINSQEIEEFLSNLTWIFIILFIGASVLAFFLSNYITKSLQQIKQRMHNIEIGKKNEPIKWQSEDEIGQLVMEYNKMLQEVEKSTDLLKKSERETAWREMAKQVAHEIKNPLTPMKLRIQHLKRAWDDKAPDFEIKLQKTSDSLIEQIDTLTNIANEFSNFAQMPKAIVEKLDLFEIVSGCIDLFKGSSEAKFTLTSSCRNNAFIRADKDQISRVFINLLTNAIQAIPEERNGKIDINIKDYDNLIIVEVKDNGSGITEELKDKIFVPNFTTKSTGTGLGLAMVKNIVENAGGTIWFTTKNNEGTVFHLSFPPVKE